MKTITIKVDDKYAGLISAAFIEGVQDCTYVSTILEEIYDNMVITIDDNGKSKTEEINND